MYREVKAWAIPGGSEAIRSFLFQGLQGRGHVGIRNVGLRVSSVRARFLCELLFVSFIVCGGSQGRTALLDTSFSSGLSGPWLDVGSAEG